MDLREKPYKYHKGTIKVSGGGEPCRIGHCAVNFWKNGVRTIDFIWMGQNAAGQAVKACLDAKAKFKRLLNVDVTFECFSCFVETEHPVTKEKASKIAYFWRMTEK